MSRCFCLLPHLLGAMCLLILLAVAAPNTYMFTTNQHTSGPNGIYLVLLEEFYIIVWNY